MVATLSLSAPDGGASLPSCSEKAARRTARMAAASACPARRSRASGEASLKRVLVETAQLGRPDLDRVAARRRIDRRHLRHLGEALGPDFESAERMRNADRLPQLQHPIDKAGQVRSGEAEIAGDARRLLGDGGPVE